MSKLIPFVTVENALEAIEFYKDVFGASVNGDITMLENVPGMEKHKGKVGHCSLLVKDTVIFVNDYLEEYPLAPGDRIQLVLELENEEELRNAFSKLAKKGQVTQELHEVFWGALFGGVKDEFGVTWQIYYGHK